MMRQVDKDIRFVERLMKDGADRDTAIACIGVSAGPTLQPLRTQQRRDNVWAELAFRAIPVTQCDEQSR